MRSAPRKEQAVPDPEQTTLTMLAAQQRAVDTPVDDLLAEAGLDKGAYFEVAEAMASGTEGGNPVSRELAAVEVGYHLAKIVAEKQSSSVVGKTSTPLG